MSEEVKSKRDFSVKFECKTCNKPVKRVTKDCDVTSKLCSDCNTKETVKKDVVSVEKPVSDNTKEVQKKLEHYRSILTAVEEAAKDNLTDNFYVLYDRARKKILGEA